MVMAFQTHNDKKQIITVGTSMQGIVRYPYASLTEAFGQPHHTTDLLWWDVKFEDDSVLSVAGRLQNLDTAGKARWVIYGTNPQVIGKLKTIMENGGKS